MKKVLLIFCILLSGCKNEKDILCDSPINTSGNMEVVNRQCIYFGDHVAAMIDIRNKDTKQIYHYTMNVVDGNIIFNLTTAQAITIEQAEQAASNSAMAAGAYANSGGRR